jgi:glycosyltransferase involved in cell wall biosynthesis
VKVLHVIPSLSRAHGGPSNAIWAMEQSVRDHSISVSVLATNENGGHSTLHQSVFDDVRGTAAIVLVPLTFMPYKVSLPAVMWLWRNIRAFDLVHAHALFSFMPIAAGLVARLRGVPYVLRPLGTLNAYGLLKRRSVAKKISLAFLEGALLRHAAAVHCTSEAEVADVRAICPTARTVVIPLAVAKFDAATSQSVSRLVGNFVGCPIILFLSRLDPKKNVEVLLDAFVALTKDNEQVVLMIAGDGDAKYVSQLRARVTNLDIARRIVWTGPVEGEQKEAAFTAASVYVLMSHSENFGIAVAEALAASVPCIVSPGVAISKEIARHGAGIVCEPNAAAVAEAIDRVLKDGVFRADAARAAQLLAAREFSSEAMGAKLAKLYRGVGVRRQ